MAHTEQYPSVPFVAEPSSVEEAEAILRQMALPGSLSGSQGYESGALPLQARADVADRRAAPNQRDRVPVPENWSEAVLRGLVQSAPDALVMVDESGTIVLVNAHTEKLFRYRRDELLGEKMELLVPERLRARHVELRERFFARPTTRPMGIGLELSGRRKDGAQFPVEISLSSLNSEGRQWVTASIRDISDRKRMEARYRTLVEGIPAVMFSAALDEGNNEFYVSPQIEAMLGFTQQEWLADPFLWYRQLHPDDRQRWGAEFARTCAAGVNFSSEYRFLSRDGREVWVHGEARAVRDDHGRPLFLQGIAFDISDSKRAEQALRQSAEVLEQKVRERTSALEEATIRAELASRARASFLANMSHEIRTPLNGIIGFADLLRRGADGTELERAEWLDIIHTSGKHLLALINDILDLSKIDAGKLDVERVACSPMAIITEVCGILRAKAEEKGLRLESVFDGPMPRTIQSDPTRLRQVLMNVAGNAIKFTLCGRVELQAAIRRPPNGDPKLIVRVIDTGVGIPADKLETIFDPFTQADSSITRQFGGTGLGLAISRRLAEQLGGGITVESEVGRGTTFICEFAIGSLEQVAWIDHAQVAIKEAEPRTAKSAPSLRNCRVLVVDDGDTNRKLIRLVLGRAGAVVEQAENGQQGVERALAESFDLILMDMQMPIMDGYSATRKLRSRGIEVPIIAMTANAMKGDDAKCLAAGCSAYISKPVDHDLLLSTVARAAAGELIAAPVPVPPSVQEAFTSSELPPGKKIVSILPTDDPEIRQIVEEFAVRLREQVQLMRTTLAARDFTRLAALAHWLKGTGGTVGFRDLAERAHRLEDAARENHVQAAAKLIAEIAALAARIIIE
jgi:PAS domain S-box-containing protein